MTCRAPFHVLATQNPLEQEGTYPLPEAQLDRFLLQIDVDYPDIEAERQILLETTGTHRTGRKPGLHRRKADETAAAVRRMPVPESVVNAILDLVRSARPGTGHAATDAHVAWGPGPRASQALMLCSRARALYDGRFAPSIDDVKALAEPVLQHRMALTFAARAEGISIRDVIADLVKTWSRVSRWRRSAAARTEDRTATRLPAPVSARRCCPIASPRPGAHRQHGDRRLARPPQARHRRNLLAVPALCRWRIAVSYRLAPLRP
jgi:Mg-chelatase subunit ChlI